MTLRLERVYEPDDLILEQKNYRFTFIMNVERERVKEQHIKKVCETSKSEVGF